MTKRTRAKAYNLLLRRFKIRLDILKKNNIHYPNGIESELNYVFNNKMDIRDFPELLACKPTEVHSSNLWWRTDRVASLQHYIDALKKAKELCKPIKK